MPRQMDSMILPPRLPLVVTTKSRPQSFTRDSRLINCYMEIDEASQEVQIVKRPGFTENSTYSESSATARGLYYWENKVFAIFGDKLYADGVQVATGLNTNARYSFSAILGATPKMVLGNGTKTYAYTTAGGLTSDLHTIDVDFPATTVPGIVYLNGATYVGQSTSQIWGSAINSVSVAGDWTALNFLSAQIEPDELVALAKQLVYVVAFGSESTEFFFDAGNPAGSPLGPVQGSKIAYGCDNAFSIQRIKDTLVWISTSTSGSMQVSMLENLNHRVVSTKDIDRLLKDNNFNTATVYSWQLEMDGHQFYVVTAKEANLTLVYDLSEDLWYQWTDTDGNYLPFVASTYNASNTLVVQHESNGKVYTINSSYTTDAGSRIIVDIYTPSFDAGNRRGKQLGKMSFIADQVEGSLLQVRYSEDDMQSWTNFRVVDLSLKEPNLVDCGTFVKRNYHFRHECDTQFRISAVDVQYDIGTL